MSVAIAANEHYAWAETKTAAAVLDTEQDAHGQAVTLGVFTVCYQCKTGTLAPSTATAIFVWRLYSNIVAFVGVVIAGKAGLAYRSVIAAQNVQLE